MAYTGQPTLNIDHLKATGLFFDTKGGALGGGRNGLGESISIDYTGGGIVIGGYRNCFVQSEEDHEYVNYLAARLNSGVRFINVPLRTDGVGPFPIIDGVPTPITVGIPHSDGSTFSDGSGYSQATVFGTMAADAAIGAGQIVVNVYGASRNLRWSDWFSIYHTVKGHRAYRYYQTSAPVAVSETVGGVLYTGSQYTISLDRPLRQAVTAGQRLRFARPLCVMKFPEGFTLPWEAQDAWQANIELNFVEAF